jgi:hypothetical protein
MEVKSTVPFNPKEVSYINETGSNSLTGQAFRRQRGGGVVTCAGETVTLTPAGPYARERFSQIYGSVSGGSFSFIQHAGAVKGDPRYHSMVKTTMCDAEGDFEFTNLADGDYYVAACVRWTVGDSITPQGGCSARLVRLRDGQAEKVLLN